MAKSIFTELSNNSFGPQKQFSSEKAVFIKKGQAQVALDKAGVDLGVIIATNTGTVATVRDIEDAQPITGFTEKNVTVADRLANPPAQNAHQFAQAGTNDLIQRLIALNPKDGPFTGVNLRDVLISGYSKTLPDDAITVAAPVTSLASLGDMIDRGGPNNITAFKIIDNQVAAAGTTFQDQSNFFYRAVSAVDNNVIILRRIEARIAQYKQLADEASALLNQLTTWQAQADARLAVLDGEITSARHHVAVAQSLKSDEMNRIDAVNTKRQAILKQVEVVVYHRPRLTDRFTLLPTTKASSVGLDGVLQVPLRELETVPQEMTQMVQNFRAAPLSWFPALDKVAQFFDRPILLMTAFNHVRMRAFAPILIENEFPLSNGKFQGAANSMIKMQATRNADWRRAGLQLDSNLIDIEGIAACHRRLRHAATLGDMIDGGHGSAKASGSAARQLERLAKAAESLYASFADTSSVLRLGWAEALLEDNGQASFQALHSLPGWLSIDVDLKREQQGLVDLLYQQVHSDNVEAVTAINRLILVALLISAHAPVSQLISARMVRPIFAQPGVIFDLTLDVSKVRIGMPIIVQNRPGEISARAIIDDIVGGQVRARILEVPKPNVTLSVDAVVHLSESVVFKTTVHNASAIQLR